jgi:hypothetical protein
MSGVAIYNSDLDCGHLILKGPINEIARQIAYAIAEERERCAKIAEEHVIATPATMTGKMSTATAVAIAKKIRSDPASASEVQGVCRNSAK